MTTTMTVPKTGLQLRSLVKASGELELSIAEVAVPEPGPDDVVVRVEATPINPSDLGLLVGAADMSSAKASGTKDRPVITAGVPAPAMRMMKPRLDQSMPVGNEGAGVVVKAGSSPAAQALLGKMVACLGGEMYSQYRMLNVAQCLALPDGTSARDGASCFVNPLTALAFVETMRAQGRTGIVHTAAASNLGQMLVKICQKDNVPLVNIVRKKEQADILKKIGAKYIVDSTSPNFMEELITALAETKTTLGFDAIGGGPLAGQLLVAMEAAASRNMKEFSRYGSGDAGLHLWPAGRVAFGRAFRRRLCLEPRRFPADAVPSESWRRDAREDAPARGGRVENDVCESLHGGDFPRRSARSENAAGLQCENDW